MFNFIRVFATIALLKFSVTTSAQSTDKQYFDCLVLSQYPNADTGSVAVYIIDAEYYTKYMTSFYEKLSSIRFARIKAIGFSHIKTCATQPGKGKIYIRTYNCKEKDKEHYSDSLLKDSFLP
jgi:hypothetical protein